MTRDSKDAITRTIKDARAYDFERLLNARTTYVHATMVNLNNPPFGGPDIQLLRDVLVERRSLREGLMNINIERLQPGNFGISSGPDA